MKKEWDLTQEAFDRLLGWLDADRDAAGEKYEKIQLRLIKFFAGRGCCEAEDRADETLNRVASKVEWLAENYQGEKILYFYGVARKVHQESLRKRPIPQLPPATEIADSESIEREYDCLEQCVSRLPADTSGLVLRYYQETRQAKINNRKRLARELGITLDALRIRAHRIRLQLRQCVSSCLEQTVN